MRLNSKILYAIISLAFVGGMFTSVYAGPILPTITLAGNVHTTGDSVVDGDLSVGGVSFAALDSRIAALETTTVPMVIANEAMITTQGNTLTTQGNTLTTQGNTLTTQGNTLTTHDSTLTTQGNTLTTHDSTLTTQGNMLTTHDTMILTNQADIVTNQADIVTNSAAIESIETGNPPPVICDTDGDGGITAQEMLDYFISQGVTNYFISQGVTTTTLTPIQNWINQYELLNTPPQFLNGVLDTDLEVNSFNGAWHVLLGIPLCPVPGVP